MTQPLNDNRMGSLSSGEADAARWDLQSGNQLATMLKGDPINHPPHYTATAYEPIDVIEAWHLGFHLGNCIKYIARAGIKTKSPIEDLKKARWYLDRFITKLETATE